MSVHKKIALFMMRIGLGWLFVYAGWSKVVTFFTAAPDWTATGFLMGTEGRPFEAMFQVMANNVVIDYLNAYGLLLIGIAIVLGVLVRWASFWGVLMMLLYWAAVYPPEHALLVDDHIIDALCFVVLASLGAGRAWGLDGWLEETAMVKKNKWLLKLLG